MTTKFETGKTYATRSICDHNAIITVRVTRRTEKTIYAETMKGTKALRVSLSNGVEQVSPWGRYSMAPLVTAEDAVTEAVEPAYLPVRGDRELMQAIALALEVA